MSFRKIYSSFRHYLPPCPSRHREKKWFQQRYYPTLIEIIIIIAINQTTQTHNRSQCTYVHCTTWKCMSTYLYISVHLYTYVGWCEAWKSDSRLSTILFAFRFPLLTGTNGTQHTRVFTVYTISESKMKRNSYRDGNSYISVLQCWIIRLQDTKMEKYTFSNLDTRTNKNARANWYYNHKNPREEEKISKRNERYLMYLFTCGYAKCVVNQLIFNKSLSKKFNFRAIHKLYDCVFFTFLCLFHNPLTTSVSFISSA